MLMKGLDSGDSTITVGAGFAGLGGFDGFAGFAGFAGVSRACTSVSSVTLDFAARVVDCGNLTLGCLGGGGSPTRNSSPGETDREDTVVGVISETVVIAFNRALVLSSCSSSASRLGEIIRRLMRISRLLVLLSIDMTNGDSQERDDKTP